MVTKTIKSKGIESDQDLLIGIYTTMLKIRRVEENLAKIFTEGEIPGFIHTCIGQEASPTAVCSQLSNSDYVATTHRGHGHALAKGVDLKRFMAEIYGKRDGLCRGRGGSIHLADSISGLLGANGIVGGSIPLATGAALAAKIKNKGQIAVSFFGEAATDQGVFHESLNMASLWKLPIVYVCENNGWAQFTPQNVHMPMSDIAKRAVAYELPQETVSNDVLKIYTVASKAINRARLGKGPTLIEVKSLRWYGHYVGDPQKYRNIDEVTHAQKDDCLKKYKAWLTDSKKVKCDVLKKVEREVEEEIGEALNFARQSRISELSDMMEDLYK
jgi:acetoin:2,6-dichlorophenolindophenol oxidoreductase subunit alpha